MKLVLDNLSIESEIGSGRITLTYSIDNSPIMDCDYAANDLRKMRDFLTKCIVIAEVEESLDKDES